MSSSNMPGSRGPTGGGGTMYSGATKLPKNARRLVGREFDNVFVNPGSFASAPVAISRTVKARKPSISGGDGRSRVKHRELFGTLYGSTALAVNNGNSGAGFYRVNPTNPNLFPWLPIMASVFDSYRFESVRLTYIPMCTTTTTGRVTLLWDPDSQDTMPVDRSTLSNYSHSTTSAPWTECTLSIPCDGKDRFTSDSNVIDRKLVDLGQLAWATYGSPASQQLGDLYIEYTVSFKEPQPGASLVQTINTLVGGALTTIGPEYAIPSVINTAATGGSVFINTPGIYMVGVAVNATSVVSVVIGGNSSLIGAVRGGFGTGAGAYMFVLNCSGLAVQPASVTLQTTGMTQMSVSIARCLTQNSFPL